MMKWLWRSVAGMLSTYFGIAIFERQAPKPAVTAVPRFANPQSHPVSACTVQYSLSSTADCTAYLPG